MDLLLNSYEISICSRHTIVIPPPPRKQGNINICAIENNGTTRVTRVILGVV